MGMQEGTRLCPSCANFSSLKHEVCQRCGYNFATGGHSSLNRPPPVIADSGAAASTTSQYKFVGVAMAALVIAVAGAVFFFTVSGSDSESSTFGTGGEVEVPPSFGGNSDSGGGSARRCYADVRGYLKMLLANDGEGSKPLADLFTEATMRLGPSSEELRILLEVYGDQRVSTVAFLDGTKPALRAGEKLARKACRKAYG